MIQTRRVCRLVGRHQQKTDWDALESVAMAPAPAPAPASAVPSTRTKRLGASRRRRDLRMHQLLLLPRPLLCPSSASPSRLPWLAATAAGSPSLPTCAAPSWTLAGREPSKRAEIRSNWEYPSCKICESSAEIKVDTALSQNALVASPLFSAIWTRMKCFFMFMTAPWLLPKRSMKNGFIAKILALRAPQTNRTVLSLSAELDMVGGTLERTTFADTAPPPSCPKLWAARFGRTWSTDPDTFPNLS